MKEPVSAWHALASPRAGRCTAVLRGCSDARGVTVRRLGPPPNRKAPSVFTPKPPLCLPQSRKSWLLLGVRAEVDGETTGSPVPCAFQTKGESFLAQVCP